MISDIIRQTSENIMTTFSVDIRPRRQVTLPSELLKKLGAEVGDSMEIKVRQKTATLKSKKQIALNALKELQRAVQESGVGLQEVLKAVDRQRLEYAKKHNK